MEKDTQKKIKEMVGSHKVFLFMKGTPEAPQCGFSMQAAHILTKLKVKFSSFDVLSDEHIRQGIKEFSNWPTIPQLYINGHFVGGCDVMAQMAKDGELQRLLEAQHE